MIGLSQYYVLEKDKFLLSSLVRVTEINPIYLIIAAVKGPQPFGMLQLIPKQIPKRGFAAISQATQEVRHKP